MPENFVGRPVDEQLSVSDLLRPEDYAAFRLGRPMVDVLNDVQWRGDFDFATEYKGRKYVQISFGVRGGGRDSGGGDIIAIFADGRFEKFVKWPEGGDKIRIGEFAVLARAVEGAPIEIRDFENDLKKDAVPRRSFDPGLTLAALLLFPAVNAAEAPRRKRNAELRDQFNAARLGLGMTERQVQSVLKAKPLYSGSVKAGPIQIYGSKESLGVFPHYSNILLLFKDGKVCGIYSGETVPGGNDGLQEMRDRFFSDLPEIPM